nr:immunoglobulin light chain junction region [Macaca mulatta]MOW56485.1 immunoglobulin light chain junction region [Macaca mulatta]MOW56658.1 immunoglobulin light chain junction region [Macaca mulatta]MOW56844.1 immunoglobulin light chain junction region [Macaca mulatta]MOW57013.1 immunoglobulin light chain junction region [Macaca mulatta]
DYYCQVWGSKTDPWIF